MKKIFLFFLLLSVWFNGNTQICIWAKLINNQGGNGNDYGTDLFVDNQGNRYVTGRWKGGNTFNSINYPSIGDRDNYIAKYDSVGNPLWAKRMGGLLSDYGYGLCGDSLGNIFHSGYFTGSVAYYMGDTIYGNGGSDVWVSRISSTGNLIWIKHFGGASTDAGYTIRTKGSSNVILAGVFSDTITFDSHVLISKGLADIFIAELDYNGNVIKVKQIGTTGDDSVNEFVMDEQGNIYVTGYFSGMLNLDAFTLSGSGSRDVLIAKIDSSFNTIWVKKGGSPQSEEGKGIAVDPITHDVYVTGSYKYGFSFGAIGISAATGTSDMFLVKYDTYGNPIWVTGGGGSSEDKGQDVELDEFGNPIVVGFFQAKAGFGTLDSVMPLGTCDLFIYKVSKDGESRTFKNYKGVIISGIYPHFERIFVDQRGFIHIAGASLGGIYFDNIYTVSSGGTADVFTGRFSPILDVNFSFSAAQLCPGDSFNLTDLSQGKVISRSFTFSSNTSSYVFTDSIVTFIPPDSGYYNLTAIISNGYETDTVFIDSLFYRNPAANFNIGIDTTLCPGSFTINSFSSLSGSVVWSTGETLDSINVQTSDLYSAIFTDQNGCSYADSVNIIFLPGNTVSLGSDKILCLMDTILLDISDNSLVQYLWQDGSTMSSLEVSASGIYSVTVSDSNSCISSDTIIVTNDTLSLSFPNNITVCPNSNYVLVPNVNELNLQYQWSDGTNLPNLAIAAPGIYWLQVTNQFGCSKIDSVLVNYFIQPATNLGPDSLICQGETILLDAGSGFVSYLWQDGSTSQTLIANSSGAYSVSVTDNNGCTDADTIIITVDPCNSISETNYNDIILYPNPILQNQVINITLDDEIIVISVYDLSGKKILTNHLDGINKSCNINYNFSRGIYLLKAITMNGNTHQYKFVIE